MKRTLTQFALLTFLGSLTFFPVASQAATFQTARVVSVSSSTPDNAYFAGESININAPLPADLVATGGTVTVSAPVARDALLAGGTIDVQRPVADNVRAVGGRVNIEDVVGGDLAVAGGFVTVSGQAKETRIAGGTVQLNNGSNGNVVIYGADVSLAGTFNGNVQVIASDKITLAEGTVIHGTFKYNAPQQAGIPASAHIDEGVTYIGSASYLPTVQQAKTFAVAGLWVFFIVRLAALLIVAGLIVGLFQEFTDQIITRAFTRSVERFILLALLGFAGFVVVPILLLLLAVSFVGLGIAFVLAAGYVLFLLLSYIYAYVLAGSVLMRLVRYRSSKSWGISWRGALVGVLLLSLLGFIPVLGNVLKFVLAAAAGGALLMQSYRFAFRRTYEDLSEF